MKEVLELHDLKHEHNQNSDLNTNRSKIDSKQTSSRQKKTTYPSNQSVWRQVKSTSVQINCRYHHTTVLHQYNQQGKSKARLYVYGGFNNVQGVLDDFKVYECLSSFQKGKTSTYIKNNNSNKWISLSTENGPGRRHSHSTVLYKDTIYLFGGKINRFSNTNSVFAYFIKQGKWKQLETYDSEAAKSQKVSKQNRQPKKQNMKVQSKSQNKPSPIDSHQAILVDNQMIVFGGFSNNQFSNKMYSLDLETMVWRRINPKIDKTITEVQRQQPQPRSDFSMVSYNDSIYIYGGKNLNKNFSDLWQFNLKTLRYRKLEFLINLETKQQQARSGHSAVVFDSYMLVFGGISTVTHQRDDLICYSFAQNRWINVWHNSEERSFTLQRAQINNQSGKKSKQKKMSNTKSKSPDCLFKETQQDYEWKKQIKKYRRPIAEQRQVKIKKEDNRQKDKYKKQNQRKYLLINQIQNALKPFSNTKTEQYSPLIESLANSIMITQNGSSGNNVLNEARLNQGRRENQSGNEKKSLLLNSQQSQSSNRQKLRKIRARDGHTCHIFNNQMIIFGGDRHLIASNDIVYVDLEAVMDVVKTQSAINQ